MATYEKADHGPYVALGMLFGIAAGIGAGMLLAPRAGEETRRKLRDKAMSAKEQAQHKMMAKRDQVSDQVSQAVDTAIDKTDAAIDKAIEKTDKAADKTTRRAREANRQIQDDTTLI